MGGTCSMPGEMHTTFLLENLNGKKHLRPRHIWKGNIKMGITEIMCEDVNLIQMTRDRVQ
jgi:hypothetical protein